MNDKRLTYLKKGTNKGKYVVYWMQQAQRIQFNHALNYAIDTANHFGLPLIVYFGLYAGYPEANLRSYQFMLEGLVEVKKWLERLGINFVLRLGVGHVLIREYLEKCHTLVFDYGYLRHQKEWRSDVLEYANKNCENLEIVSIDTDVIVPVEYVSQKREYGAYTLRPKLLSFINEFRDMDKMAELKNKTKLELILDDDLSDINLTLQKLDLNPLVPKSNIYKGGYIEASHLFSNFIIEDASEYKDRNDPGHPHVSHMSMYLHFGQISPLDLLERIYLAHQQGQIDLENRDAFIEQLVVRRELAINFVTYNKGYDQFDQMTQAWAYETMNEHQNDKRLYNYGISDYIAFKTHDKAFNAAMKEMVVTGYMHNYMRMYWAKKIIEWTDDFKQAYETILYLNNKYFIDGRDANSYAGVAWCFGNHDRPWKERKIFGMLRYMNEEGLKRKFDIEAYIKKWE